MIERWLWIDGQAAGPFSEMTVERKIAKGEASGDTLYWHDATEEWLPLTRFRDDVHAEELREIRSAGFHRVEFVAARTDGECPVCQALHGKRFAISEAPKIPPPGCTCDPWSQATLVGHH